jgi:hypothetical protein
MEDFAERAWRTNPLAFVGLDPSPEDTASVDGRLLSAGQIMQGLTKIIHAEQHVEAMMWANSGLGGSPGADAMAAARLVSDALILVIKQLMSGVSTLLKEQGKTRDSAISRYQLQMPSVAITPPAPSLWPVNLLLVEEGLARGVLRQASNYEAVFRGERPEGRLYNDAEMMLLCFSHYRARCINSASAAFAAETKHLGKALTLDGFSGTEMPPVVVSEMAAVFSSWVPSGSPSRAAAVAVADALRGAYWLWLEDDNRAMALLRVALEQTARLRVWRLKPQHGPNLESLGKPSRWIAKAGWGRLTALNRALGEFSHYRPNVAWGGAFDLLVQLNHGVSTDEAPLIARRQALEVITRLVAKEICEQVRSLNHSVADAFVEISQEIAAGGPEVDCRIDEYLNHAHTFRSHDFSAVPEMRPRTRS